MPQVRALADLVITLDVGALSSWKFHDMKPITKWVTLELSTLLVNDLIMLK